MAIRFQGFPAIPSSSNHCFAILSVQAIQPFLALSQPKIRTPKGLFKDAQRMPKRRPVNAPRSPLFDSKESPKVFFFKYQKLLISPKSHFQRFPSISSHACQVKQSLAKFSQIQPSVAKVQDAQVKDAQRTPQGRLKDAPRMPQGHLKMYLGCPKHAQGVLFWSPQKVQKYHKV